MSYHGGQLGEAPSTGTTKSASASASANANAWRAPIVAAADRFLVAVRNAFRKMPQWPQGRFYNDVAEGWFSDARTKTLDQLRVRNAFFAPISPTSMPAERTGSQRERDEVLAAQLALKSAVAPPAPVSAPVSAPTSTIAFFPAPSAPSVAPSTPATAPSTPAPSTPAPSEVECSDGYFRDVTGVCVPGVTGPSVLPPPDVSIGPSPLPAIDTAIVSSPPLPSLTDTEKRLMGVPLKTWAIGAVVAGVGLVGLRYLSASKVQANRRRRMRRNIYQTRAGVRVHGQWGLGTVREVHGDNVKVEWDSGKTRWVDRSTLDPV